MDTNSRRIKIIRWWRNTSTQTRAIIFLAGVILLSLLVFLQVPSDESVFLQSNLVIFAFVNLNIVFICILAFLVGRNIVKLIFDRQRQILGSKLRLKLVTAFVGLALVPTVGIYLLASGLLNQAMEGWFSKQVDKSVKASLMIAQLHYKSMVSDVTKVAKVVASELKQSTHLRNNVSGLNKFINHTRQHNGLFALALLEENGTVIVASYHTAAAVDDFKPPAPDLAKLSSVIKGGSQVVQNEQGSNQFISAYVMGQYKGKPIVVLATMRVKDNIREAYRKIYDSHREYGQLKLFKNPVRSGYELTLALVAGLILFSAIWIGFYIAREISVPIQKLAEGTQAVAAGDYDYFVRVSGDDEVAFLVRSFNRMTADLKQTRKDAERRRVLIEAILASLTVGVIAIDRRGLVTAANQTACNFLELGDASIIAGKNIKSLLNAELSQHLSHILPEGRAQVIKEVEDLKEVELEFEYESANGKRRLTCATSIVRSTDDLSLGLVLILDDITDLVRAQQMEAWREVARRIAHEIKNPLTPLQLCAQRLQKLLADSGNQAVLDSTVTIVEHVASIKRLADEFSKFARMPQIDFAPVDVVQLIAGVISSYVDSQPQIVFRCISEPNLPKIMADYEQLRRCLINLIDNAINALTESKQDSEQLTVIVQAFLNAQKDHMLIEVIDNGPGILPENRNRIFEPYFTTRQSGTGLGLAVVSSIIADHHGTIRVLANQPRGTRMVIELPVVLI